MAFDAGILRAVVCEIDNTVTDGRIEKIYQPERDEIILIIRNSGREHRLLINAGSSCPRMNITGIKTENPSAPPMFCMMLRKYFTGGRLIRTEQPGGERVARLTFECRDDMGFRTERHIIAELMGKYSNIIITDNSDRITGVLKPIDFSASTIRQLLPGMTYTLPPSQNKLDPNTADRREFMLAAAAADKDMPAAKFISSVYSGIAAVSAREIVFRASGSTTSTLSECTEKLYDELCSVMAAANAGGCRSSVAKSKDGMPIEYMYTELTQYENGATITVFPTVGAAIDEFYLRRAAEERLKRRAADIFRILGNAEARTEKKIVLQRDELLKCERGDEYRRAGDLITASIYKLRRGMESVTLTDWESGEDVIIPLSPRLTPAQNAQQYYKKYNKAKSAKIHLTEQLEISEHDLKYLSTVRDALNRASTEQELSEIRAELFHSGFASKMKNYTEKKRPAPLIMRFKTRDGHTVLCGKNNTANDYLTTKLAKRSDWWFHVKGQPGSHAVLECAPGESDPPESAFTDAAMIAAHYSSASGGASVPVDYTKVKEVKKPSGSKPGFVIYHTNFTAYVTPDEDAIRAMEDK